MKINLHVNELQYSTIRTAVKAYILCLREIIEEDGPDPEYTQILQNNEDFIAQLEHWGRKFQ